MEVLSRLRSTVSAVMPGNPVTREYEILRPVGSAGPALLWRIYAARKKTTQQEASVFVFEKRCIESYGRADRDAVLEALKRGVAQLTRLRHPKLLTVQHPLEDSRESLAFATEPVFASLSNVLGNHENIPHPVPADLTQHQLYEVEIKYGILQVCEGLLFLHQDAKLLHRNICPESIIISACGAWKIAGFEFCAPLTDNKPALELSPDVHPNAQPNLSFVAPETALQATVDVSADLFSLGALISAVFNKGDSVLGACASLASYRTKAKELMLLPASALNNVPAGLREHIKSLLSVNPDSRPDTHRFTKIPFFEDVGAKSLEYLDTLFHWDSLQKSQFYKGLPRVINTLPKRVNLLRVVPALAKEFVNADMVPFVLPSVLLIAEDATSEEFCRCILPELRPVFRYKEPMQIPLILMHKMDLLLSKTPADDVKSCILPLVYQALESSSPQLQEMCLNTIPSFSNVIDYHSMKNALLPRIKAACTSSQQLSVRVHCLLCMGKLLEHLDKWVVLDDVLPFLTEIPSREPAVLMAVIGIYRLALTHKKLGITKDILANKVIPFLMPLSIESDLSLSQFNTTMALIKEMVELVETEHRAKLQQLSSTTPLLPGINACIDGLDLHAPGHVQSKAAVTDHKSATDLMSSVTVPKETNHISSGQTPLVRPPPQPVRWAFSSGPAPNLSCVRFNAFQTAIQSTGLAPGPALVPAPALAPGPVLAPGTTPAPGPTLAPGSAFAPGPAFVSGPALVPGPAFVPGPALVPGPTLSPGPVLVPGSVFLPLTNQSQQTVGNKVNLSAFDSLLPTGAAGRKDKVSLNDLAQMQKHYNLPSTGRSVPSPEGKRVSDLLL